MKENIKELLKYLIIISLVAVVIPVTTYLFIPSVDNLALATFENKGLYYVEHLSSVGNVTDKYKHEVNRTHKYSIGGTYYYITIFTPDDGGYKHKAGEVELDTNAAFYDAVKIGDTVRFEGEVYYSKFGARLFRGDIRYSIVEN